MLFYLPDYMVTPNRTLHVSEVEELNIIYFALFYAMSDFCFFPSDSPSINSHFNLV